MQPKNAHALNNQWKRQDTTQDLIVWFSGVMPNPAHAWTVRVANSKGYLGDYDATLQGNRFVIDTGQFADFPVDHYVLEIWETYSKDGKAETGIYPNPDSFVTFDINKNVVDDDLVKSFDLDEVLGKAAARANKAIVVDGTETLPAGSQAAVESRYDGERVHYTFKIPQGAQGIQGPQGKTGAQGPQGIQGIQGPQGRTGQTGPVGPAPTLRVGSVTKVAPGGSPTASVTGGNGDYSINLGIPEGQQGTGFNWTRIQANADLNDYKQSGYYSAHGSSGIKNIPQLANTAFFHLIVFSDGDTCTQILTDPNTSATYVRCAISGNTYWTTDWKKLGGVSDGSLSPNLVPSGNTPTFWIDEKTDSTPHLSAQRFGYIYNKECLTKNNIIVLPNKGDVIKQSVIVRTSAGAELDNRIAFTYFEYTPGHYQHHVVPTTITPLDNNQYLVSATWTIPTDGFRLRLMDLTSFGLHSTSGDGSDAWIEIDSPYAGLVQLGGVVATNLTPTLESQSSLVTQGIGHRTVPAGSHSLYDDYRYKVTKFEPSTRYRLSFTAWGSGNVLTHVYPGATPGERGNGDGQKTWALNAAPTQYSYEFDSFAQLSGDPQKTLLFRIPAGDQAVDFNLDTSSVVLEKVGGVAKAPSQPSAKGLLYTGSFTVSTGSTPAWAYKAIQVGDMDGDTLTVTLTPHQTAGAKLDQVCVALYDSTRTTALATYAYPATEQTSTITIVDKWPGKDAQLLFYANDKTINSNTTIEFGNVTIVGS